MPTNTALFSCVARSDSSPSQFGGPARRGARSLRIPHALRSPARSRRDRPFLWAATSRRIVDGGSRRSPRRIRGARVATAPRRRRERLCSPSGPTRTVWTPELLQFNSGTVGRSATRSGQSLVRNCGVHPSTTPGGREPCDRLSAMPSTVHPASVPSSVWRGRAPIRRCRSVVRSVEDP